MGLFQFCGVTSRLAWDAAFARWSASFLRCSRRIRHRLDGRLRRSGACLWWWLLGITLPVFLHLQVLVCRCWSPQKEVYWYPSPLWIRRTDRRFILFFFYQSLFICTYSISAWLSHTYRIVAEVFLHCWWKWESRPFSGPVLFIRCAGRLSSSYSNQPLLKQKPFFHPSSYLQRQLASIFFLFAVLFPFFFVTALLIFAGVCGCLRLLT